MSAQDPEPGAPSAGQDEAEAHAKRRNPWIWVSALLALVAAGALLWALTTRSDLDSANQELDSTEQELAGANQQLDDTNQELDSTQQELDSTKQDVEELQTQGDGRDGNGGALLAIKALYDEFSEQLGATQEDLAATQDDLEQAEKAASKGEKEAAAAKQEAAEAGNQADKLEAQADQATAEAKAAEAKAAVAVDCAKAYIAAFGGLFDGESVRDQAPVVREQLAGITADCKDELNSG